MQYGCGLNAPRTWKNFDSSPTLRVQKLQFVGRLVVRSSRFPTFPKNVEYGDIVNGLPLERGSCRAIYCSHVLEHLALNEFRRALKNTFSYLADGGIFRLVMPDLRRLATDYLESNDAGASHRFMRESHLGKQSRPSGVEGFARTFVGNSAHLWMWDYESTQAELTEVGFIEIRRAFYGDSTEERFADVEDEERWKDCLGIECRKHGT